MTEVAYLRKLGYRLERRVTLYTEGRSPSHNARYACLSLKGDARAEIHQPLAHSRTDTTVREALHTLGKAQFRDAISRVLALAKVHAPSPRSGTLYRTLPQLLNYDITQAGQIP